MIARGPGTRTSRIARVDLGLALLECLVKPNVPIASEDIAAWCDISRQGVEWLEKRAMRKVRQRLGQFGRDYL